MNESGLDQIFEPIQERKNDRRQSGGVRMVPAHEKVNSSLYATIAIFAAVVAAHTVFNVYL